MAKEKCVICNNECSWIDSNKLKDKKRLCFNCQHIIVSHNKINKHILVVNIDKVTSEDIKKMYEDPNLSIHDFYRTKKTEADLQWCLEAEQPKKEQKPYMCMEGMSYESVKQEILKSDKKKCIVCFKKAGLTSRKLKDKTYLCFDCEKVIEKNNDINRKLSPWLNELNGNEIRELFEKPRLSIHDFYCTDKTRISLEAYDELEHTREICGVRFNDLAKEISFGKLDVLKEFLVSADDAPSKYPYKNLIKYEYKEGENIVTQGGSGIGSAIVGGVLFGGVGAVVGAATNKRTQKNVISDMSVYMTFEIDGKRFLKKVKINEFLDNEIKYGSTDYMKYLRQAEQLIGVLDEIYLEYHKNDKSNLVQNVSANVSNADEIRKYKELLDDGIISESEFEKVKKQLLNY